MNTDNSRKRKIWPYIVVTVAVIAAVAVIAVLVFPSLLGGRSFYTPVISKSVYADNETALKSPSSYDDLYATLDRFTDKNRFSLYTAGGNASVDYAVEEAAEEDSASTMQPETAAAAAESAEKNSDYSDTNVRTEGVYEGDIVKTDGRYIYSAFPSTGEFSIVDTEDGMKTVYTGHILEDDYYTTKEFYVIDDRLFFTGARDEYVYDNENSSSHWLNQAFILTYDISDRSNPVLSDKYMQSGNYLTVRIKDGYFYLFTNYSNYDLDKNNFTPYFGGVQVEPSDVYYGRYFTYPNYYCMSAVSLDAPSMPVSSKAVISDTGDFYVSDSTIFVVSSDYIVKANESYSSTDIVSLSYKDGMISGNSTGSVPGYINDSFSIDEYNGYLRLVTTTSGSRYRTPGFFERWFGSPYYDSVSYEENNALWILKDDLSVVSKLEGIQKDEIIQSARFMGDIVYFVTFRNTDPLFAADLSDPSNPKILDGIKVTGFSNYLHPYSDDLLLGIGYDGTETGNITGVKLSMFDTSDPTNLREKDRYSIDASGCTISSDYSYKAVMVDPEKNLIGFAMEKYVYDPEEKFEGNIATYYVFSYDEEKGFTKLIEKPLYNYNYHFDYYPYIEDDIFYEEDVIKEDDAISYSRDQIPADEIAAEETQASQEADNNSSFFSGSSVSDNISSESTGSKEGSIFSGYESVKKEKYPDPLEDLDTDDPSELSAYYTIQCVRGLYIGDQFYIVHPGIRIYDYDLNNYKLHDMLTLYEKQN